MTPAEQLSERLFRARAQDEVVFALLDAARDGAIHEAVTQSGLEHAALYESADETLRAVAPYLVRLAPDAGLTRRLLAEGWGQSWGMVVVAPPDLRELRRHFRKFLRVRAHGGGILYFRFYDPRVLRAYLPTCSEEELKQVFGPVRRFEIESDDGRALVTFTLAAGFDGRLSLGVSRLALADERAVVRPVAGDDLPPREPFDTRTEARTPGAPPRSR